MKKIVVVLAGSMLMTFLIVIAAFRYSDAKARQEFNERRAKECREKDQSIQEKLNARLSREQEAQLRYDLDKLHRQCADGVQTSRR